MHYTNSTDTAIKAVTYTRQRPVRILHVVGEMIRAGTETWLMHSLRNIDRDRFHMDFLVHTTHSCAYDDEIRALGSKVISCPTTSSPWLYASNFKRILRECGSYDIVHSHVHHFSGYVLRLAQEAGVPIRIAHSHFNSSLLKNQAKWSRRFYVVFMKWWIRRYATTGLAASNIAGADLFGKSWERDRRWRTLYCGIDLTPFQASVNSSTVRAEFNIPTDAFVIGHVGRFEQPKNHLFLLEIAAEVRKKEPKMYVLLVGDGVLRPDIEQKAIQMGLADRVIFAKVRPDIPRLMLGAMDVFLFPSLCEGLGLVLVEAQAAGLPCILSDVIPEEADVAIELMQRMSLSQPASSWADAILSAKKNNSKINQVQALEIVEHSKFNIQTSVKELQQLYLDTLLAE